MTKMNFNEVMNVVNNYSIEGARTRFGHHMVAVVSLKESSLRSVKGRHIIGHAAKVTMVNNVLFPKYDSKVASVLGLSMTPAPLNGMTWVNYPYIKRANKSGYDYLNIYYGVSDIRMEFTTKWLWDGRLATAAEIAEIESWLKPKDNRPIKAAMYQIEPINSWDGFFYLGEDKEKAKEIYNQIG
jgi:hypothetical protein